MQRYHSPQAHNIRLRRARLYERLILSDSESHYNIVPFKNKLAAVARYSEEDLQYVHCTCKLCTGRMSVFYKNRPLYSCGCSLCRAPKRKPTRQELKHIQSEYSGNAEGITRVPRYPYRLKTGEHQSLGIGERGYG